MKTITIATQKGGTGKTTTAAALAQAAIYAGKKVLCIDLDAQRDLTLILSADSTKQGAFDLLNGERIQKTIQPTKQGIDVISASWDLSTLKTSKGSAYRLQEALEDVKRLYDLTIIDTPPNINVLQYNALQACNVLIIPMGTDIFSLQALYSALETAAEFKKTNKGFKAIGALLTMYDGRSVLSRDMEKTIKDRLKENNVIYMGKIRNAVALKEAQTMQQSLYDYAPKCKPAEDYMKLLNIILREV